MFPFRENMPPCHLLSPSLHPVVPSRVVRLTIAARAAGATLYLHHTHSHLYSLTASSRSRSQTNQQIPRKEQEEEEGEGHRLGKPLDDDYYGLLLSSPLPSRTATSSSSSPAPPVSSITTSIKNQSPSTAKPEPRVIFGSRLVGPAARQREDWAQERPQEPDNCCMSGCVNCVWEAYREEVEEWAARRRKWEAKDKRAVLVGVGQGVESSTGGLDGAAVGGELEAGALFEGVPVGIREFMALEKRLRLRERDREGTDRERVDGQQRPDTNVSVAGDSPSEA